MPKEPATPIVSKIVLEKINRALLLRAAIRAADTDVLRIVDGRGDGFDNLAIDDFAGHWLVETRENLLPEWLEAMNQESGKNGKSGNDELSFPDFLISRLNFCGVPKPKSIYWKKLGEKESPVWIAGKKLEQPFVVRENGIKYWIDFNAGYSQGIFPDQRENRLALRQAVGRLCETPSAAPGVSQKRPTVLNCFAYTCAFGVSGAIGGAGTVNLDLSKRYLEWGKRNYALNDIDPAQHDFIYGDVLEWLKRFRKKGRAFDIILLDPPTFSRNEKGAVFTIESGFGPLVREAEKVLSPGGVLFCSTNQRGLGTPEFRRLISSGLENPSAWKWQSSPMPPDFSGEAYLKTWWLQSPEQRAVD